MKGDFNETTDDLVNDIKKARDHYKDVSYAKNLQIEELRELLDILKQIPDLPKLARYLIITKEKELLRNG